MSLLPEDAIKGNVSEPSFFRKTMGKDDSRVFFLIKLKAFIETYLTAGYSKLIFLSKRTRQHPSRHFIVYTYPRTTKRSRIAYKKVMDFEFLIFSFHKSVVCKKNVRRCVPISVIRTYTKQMNMI